MHISEFELSGMFSFKMRQRLHLREGLNVLIGKNNAGKSNVLRGIKWLTTRCEYCKQQKPLAFDEECRYQHADGSAEAVQSILLRVGLNTADIANMSASLMASLPQHASLVRAVEGVVAGGFTLHASSETGCRFGNNLVLTRPVGQELLFTSSTFASMGYGVFEGGQIEHARQAFAGWLSTYIRDNCVYVGGWRKLDEPRAMGAHLVKAMHEWSQPPRASRHLRTTFHGICELFMALSGLRDVDIVPQSDGREINISFGGGRYLPLTSFGDGFVHLLILAFELITKKNSVFLIEEIETHLHPEVQRRIVMALNNRKDIQSIITTHSPVLLDAAKSVSIARITHDEEFSRIEAVATRKEMYVILDDLRSRPSDILQSNCVIWVEGPSDRVFIAKCISLAAPDLKENIHYTFAYYAGRLRARWTASGDDDDLGLIDIIRMGRKIVMVADSDRSGETDKIDESKTRLDAEVRACGGVSWITAGTEIENYLQVAAVERACRIEVGALQGRLTTFSDFSHVLSDMLSDVPDAPGYMKRYGGNKVDGMEAVCACMKSDALDVLDLKERIVEVVEYIRGANQ